MEILHYIVGVDGAQTAPDAPPVAAPCMGEQMGSPAVGVRGEDRRLKTADTAGWRWSVEPENARSTGNNSRQRKPCFRCELSSTRPSFAESSLQQLSSIQSKLRLKPVSARTMRTCCPNPAHGEIQIVTNI